MTRRASLPNTGRIEHIMDKITLHDGDLSDTASIMRIMSLVHPDEVYNLAAQSHVQVSFDVPEYSGDVDAIGVLRMLEAIPILGMRKKTCKFYQASTSELFGKGRGDSSEGDHALPPVQPLCGCQAIWLLDCQKNIVEAYGMFAVNGILFNHESERRGETL